MSPFRPGHIAALLLLVSSACGPGQNAVNDGSTGAADAVGTSDGQSAGDGGANTSDSSVNQPDAASATPQQFCQVRCDAPADCDLGSAPYDADNYRCQDNACLYSGCNGDGECQVLGNYVCRTLSGHVMPLCHVACNGPSDCDLGSAPYDADNYNCENGACAYTGCNSDAECQALGNYRCRTAAGATVATCQAACATVNDCDMGSAPYDVDNYSCEDDVCVYQGCNGNAECQALGDYICAGS